MRTEWAFAFLNTAIVIFCLIYSLNIPHNNQNTLFFSVQDSVLSLKNFYFGDISPYRNDRSHMKIILTFLFVRFITGDVNIYYT